MAAGDLQADVRVLAEYSACSGGVGGPRGADESRALLQVIHDVAPEAVLAFHSAGNGLADFAQGIGELADAGAEVIVDDVGYFAEPMFQDGPIARASDRVAARGVTYVTAAGNNARNAYVAPFRAVEATLLGTAMRAHDFDPGPGVDSALSLLMPAQTIVILVLQWDDPFFSASGPPWARPRQSACGPQPHHCTA